ncbi:MAG: hypoxanthine phosphoribosyltransferase [Eggerthellaceae bacterium]|jgi:hypoxanthine phosphoribosyltransferase
MHSLHPDIERICITEEQLRERVTEMGQQITKDYAGEDVVVVSVLRGAAIFMADLVRAIDLPVEMDYMAISSYGSGAVSSGIVRVLKDITTDIKDRHVIIAEDIVDSGLTLKYTIKSLASHHPADIEVAALLYKERDDAPDIDCKYVGFTVPDEFIVGYGLDYAERYRNLPYIGILKHEVYDLGNSHGID